MRRIADTRLDYLAKSVGLDQEDLARIQSSKKRGFHDKLNPAYWFGQLSIFLISLFYSVVIGTEKDTPTYPFGNNISTLILAPLPLSAHIINAFYSGTGNERAGLSKRVRIIIFIVNFSLFVFLFLYFFEPITPVYNSAVDYGVFDAAGNSK
ncbi:MAG: hypothetical protein ACW97P_07970 [Candidatus Hodarchaeales archaeon]